MPRLDEMRVLFHCGDELRGCSFITASTTLSKTKGRDRLTSALLLLLCDFEDDIEFDRHPEGKAGNADYDPNRCFLDAKDIAK